MVNGSNLFNYLKVVKQNFTHDMVGLLTHDMKEAIAFLGKNTAF